MPEPGVKEVVMAGGIASSSECPRLHLIPTEALLRLAARFELGVERKKEKAWNAISPNQACLMELGFILSRIDHVIRHASLLRDKIIAGKARTGDDDAGAIAWAGAFLCCVTAALDKPAPNCSACGGTGNIVLDHGTDVRDCPACRASGISRIGA